MCVQGGVGQEKIFLIKNSIISNVNAFSAPFAKANFHNYKLPKFLGEHEVSL